MMTNDGHRMKQRLTYGTVGLKNLLITATDPQEIARLRGKIEGLEMAGVYVDEVCGDD